MALSQKEALGNLLDSFDGALVRPLRLLFLSYWLEDINWHTENRLLWEMTAEGVTKAAQELADRTNEIKELTDPRVTIAGYPCDRSMLSYELKKVSYYHALNMIFGWGLDNSFVKNGGPELVDELMRMAGIPAKPSREGATV